MLIQVSPFTFKRSILAVGVACALGIVFAPAAPARQPAAIRVRVFDFVDHSRTIRLPDGRRVPRKLVTVVRSPSTGGPHPLIVFGHGFTLTPAPYSALLRSWARAGFVVAAPVFPLGNANAPGGPDESDIVNQPRDMSFVISKLLAMSRQPGVLHGLIDASEVAVAGHSDGAVTALATAYDSRFRDPRVRAAVILSGATLGGMGAFPRRGPPLLAMQGTADPINPPLATADYFALAPRPKFLVWLIGASHLPPYTDEEPQLGIVERVTISFLDHYLESGPLGTFERAARKPGLTRFAADP